MLPHSSKWTSIEFLASKEWSKIKYLTENYRSSQEILEFLQIILDPITLLFSETVDRLPPEWWKKSLNKPVIVQNCSLKEIYDELNLNRERQKTEAELKQVDRLIICAT